MLRRACAEGAKKLNLLASDTGAQVDRRIVVKLLITFYERNQSPDVLALMARMLGFTSASLLLANQDRASVCLWAADARIHDLFAVVTAARSQESGC